MGNCATDSDGTDIEASCQLLELATVQVVQVPGIWVGIWLVEER